MSLKATPWLTLELSMSCELRSIKETNQAQTLTEELVVRVHGHRSAFNASNRIPYFPEGTWFYNVRLPMLRELTFPEGTRFRAFNPIQPASRVSHNRSRGGAYREFSM